MQRCGKDEHAAFPFSRDQAILRITCLSSGSTGSPGVTAVREEGLGLCGFCSQSGSFFLLFSFLFLFFSLFVMQGGPVGTSDPAMFFPASAVGPNSVVGCVCLN